MRTPISSFLSFPPKAGLTLLAGAITLPACAQSTAQTPAQTVQVPARLAASAPARFSWSRVNIAGGGLNSGVLVHPGVPDLVYARQDVSGLLRWDAPTKKWVQLLDWMPLDWQNAKGCAGFAVDPNPGKDATRGSTIYAALGQYVNRIQSAPQANGIWRSTDRGATWTKVWDGILVQVEPGFIGASMSFASNLSTRMAGEPLAVDPFNPDCLWAGTLNAGLYRSLDIRSAKPTFQKVEGAPTGFVHSAYEPSGIRGVLLDPRGGFVGAGAQKRTRVVFLGVPRPDDRLLKEAKDKGATDTPEFGVFRSQDGGATWQLLAGGGAPTTFSRMALGPQVGQLYSASGEKGLRFFDGTKWTTSPGTADVSFAGVDSLASNRLSVVAGGSDNATWASRDGGGTWTHSGPNTGATWDKINWVTPGFTSPNSPAYALDTFHDGQALYGDSFGVHRALDVFAPKIHWMPQLNGYETSVAWSIASPPVGPRLYYVTADVNGFIWDDDVSRTPQTQLWERVFPDDRGGPPGQENWGIGDAACSDIEWASGAPQNQVVLRSTWKGYYSGYARIYRSADAGKSWEGFPAPPPTAPDAPDSAKSAGAAKIAISATDPNRMVYVRPWSAPVYTANGMSGKLIEWKPSTGTNFYARDIWPYYVNLIRLAADASNGMRFYLSNRNGDKNEVWVSDDGGASWAKPATQNLPSSDGEFLMKAVKGADGAGELWITCANNGLWRSRDGARTFERVNQTAVSYAKGFAFGPPMPGQTQPALYLAGRVKGQDGVWQSNDWGATWTAMTAPALPLVGGLGINDMEADPRAPGRVYIATAGTGVVYSSLAAR